MFVVAIFCSFCMFACSRNDVGATRTLDLNVRPHVGDWVNGVDAEPFDAIEVEAIDVALVDSPDHQLLLHPESINVALTRDTSRVRTITFALSPTTRDEALQKVREIASAMGVDVDELANIERWGGSTRSDSVYLNIIKKRYALTVGIMQSFSESRPHYVSIQVLWGTVYE